MGRLVFRPQALIDLDDIFDYIAEDSLDRAITFIRKLHGKMEKLATSPGIGRHSDEQASKRELKELLSAMDELGEFKFRSWKPKLTTQP